jgi:hypothetical protein
LLSINVFQALHQEKSLIHVVLNRFKGVFHQSFPQLHFLRIGPHPVFHFIHKILIHLALDAAAFLVPGTLRFESTPTTS